MKKNSSFIVMGLVMVITTMLALTACQNTVHGMGQDMDRITGEK
jgi:predicted small secreted protein